MPGTASSMLTRTCPQCGKKFQVTRASRQKYCSDKCRWIVARDLRRQRVKDGTCGEAPPPLPDCLYNSGVSCDCKFTKCGHCAWNPAASREVRVCEFCGRTFYGSGHMKYCSAECQRAMTYKRIHEHDNPDCCVYNNWVDCDDHSLCKHCAWNPNRG